MIAAPLPITPVVSVVMATYNRADVLAHAIASVIGQTMPDWELLVVGDACTDATEAVVAAFDDRRVRFVNRRDNHGEQSAPNNDGVALARGAYVAFLNHDDLWYPDHLERALHVLEAGDADLAYGLRAVVDPDRTITVRGAGAIRRGLLVDPVPASTWVYRRPFGDRVGPWRSAFDLRLAPSQDWLVRALTAGARVHCTDAISVVMVPSGNRKGSYRSTDPEDSRVAADLIARDRRETLLAASRRSQQGGTAATVRRALRRALQTLCLRCGYHPYVVHAIARAGRRRGAQIRRLRRVRGLSPEPRARHG